MTAQEEAFYSIKKIGLQLSIQKYHTLASVLGVAIKTYHKEDHKHLVDYLESKLNVYEVLLNAIPTIEMEVMCPVCRKIIKHPAYHIFKNWKLEKYCIDETG